MVEIIVNFQELVQEKQWKTIRDEIVTLDPLQIAEIIEELSDDEDLIVFRLLPRELAKSTFQHLSHDKQEEIIEGLAHNVNKLSSLLNDLDPDDRTAFFEELPGEIAQRLIQLLSPQERRIATTLLGYPEDSIGRLMTPEFVAIKPHYTVEEALNHIRKFGRDSETLNVVYIVDNQWKLIDDIRIREIILATPDQKIEELMDYRFVALSAFDDQEMAVRVFQDQDRVALPVVNSEGLLLGIVTFDDMMDVAEEETTEDFHKFGAFQEAVVNPLKAKISSLYKTRVVWLTALVFVNVFSGAAISKFESVIQSVVSLVFFLPLLIDSSGNAGSQSATLMIRSLAVGEVKLSDWYRLIGKEVLVSLLLGITMAIGAGIVANFRSPEIVVVVGLTMVLTVMAGSLIGMLLPFIFTKLKLDPATASAPLITSIADISGVLIYFSIARWYLGL
ncbi:MAG: magnesium transporter [Tenuifilaceae bacterium]|jgi:magnesium transporter|nr:magnesium transporter [Bacteroidales bacterium]MDI9516226.1 magnesium transporter [Bacteroidota bacterium]NLH57520.1 magnesium transporter [Rikenellaceae bacterium]OQC64927.1 MAG: Magnesium transporter MgtE [Bacteroidetes bacterium ADurb.Bin008]HNV80410.1 magnesium transporter [Tenuifilaceae bacterium]